MKIHALRLFPNQFLKEEILQYAKINKISAGFIITCVGSLNYAVLRLSDQKEPSIFTGKFEILSLVGTFSENSGHFHICLSDYTGKTFGGHLLDGCNIYTTAEIVIGEESKISFKRAFDSKTGYKELEIEKIK